MTSPHVSSTEVFPIHAIGKVISPFHEKFAVPRQPGLTPSVISEIHVKEPYGTKQAFEGLEAFSHIWLIFSFHQNKEQGWKAQVRPPRLGGNEKLGVFATRSSFRPNGLGMSVVKLIDIRFNRASTVLSVTGLDVVDGTPVIDIKPYIAYTDAIADAGSGFAQAPPDTIEVVFTKQATGQLEKLSMEPELRQQQIAEALAQDPRPAYRKRKKQDDNEYGVGFAGMNFKWRLENHKIYVFAVTKI